MATTLILPRIEGHRTNFSQIQNWVPHRDITGVKGNLPPLPDDKKGGHKTESEIDLSRYILSRNNCFPKEEVRISHIAKRFIKYNESARCPLLYHGQDNANSDNNKIKNTGCDARLAKGTVVPTAFAKSFFGRSVSLDEPLWLKEKLEESPTTRSVRGKTEQEEEPPKLPSREGRQLYQEPNTIQSFKTAGKRVAFQVKFVDSNTDHAKFHVEYHKPEPSWQHYVEVNKCEDTNFDSNFSTEMVEEYHYAISSLGKLSRALKETIYTSRKDGEMMETKNWKWCKDNYGHKPNTPHSSPPTLEELSMPKSLDPAVEGKSLIENPCRSFHHDFLLTIHKLHTELLQALRERAKGPTRPADVILKSWNKPKQSFKAKPVDFHHSPSLKESAKNVHHNTENESIWQVSQRHFELIR